MKPIELLATEFGMMKDGKWCLRTGHLIGFVIGAAWMLVSLAWFIRYG